MLMVRSNGKKSSRQLERWLENVEIVEEKRER
jgi:hypothetical protein